MSTTLKLPKDDLSALRPEDVQLYLTSRGWQKEPAASTDKATVYRFPNQPDAEVLLPRTRDLADYALRMGDVVQMIAAVEQRAIHEVLVDLSAPPADVIRLRILAPEASLGTLPLDEDSRSLQRHSDQYPLQWSGAKEQAVSLIETVVRKLRRLPAEQQHQVLAYVEELEEVHSASPACSPAEVGAKDSLVRQLEELAGLGPNWDGYSAPRIDPAIIASARRFVKSLPDDLASWPTAVPLSSGGLQLEWHNGPRVLELEFESPDTLHYLKWDPRETVEEEDLFPISQMDRAIDLIQWFHPSVQHA